MATAAAATPPTIETESISNVSGTDATLEAHVNLQEAAQGAYAQFQLVESPSEFAPEILCPPETSHTEPCIGTHSSTALPIEFLPANAMHPESFDVASLNLNSAGVTLTPGNTYHWRLLIARRVPTEDTIQWEEPTVFGEEKTFTAAARPTIGSESLTNLTSTDATLEALVNPPPEEGAGAYYQFQIAKDPSQLAGEILCPPETSSTAHPCIGTHSDSALPIGFVWEGSEHLLQAAKLDLASAGVTLEPGTTYYWRVIAVRAVRTEDTIQWEEPTIYGADQTFTTPSAGVPLILNESISNVTPTDATLEATIEPRGGRNAFYQFQLVKEPSEFASEILCPPPPYQGYSACAGTQSASALPIDWVCGECEIEPATRPVHLDLASAGVTLEPGATYHFRVLAARAVPTEDTIQWGEPTVFGADQTFTTTPNSVVCPLATDTCNGPPVAPPLACPGNPAGGSQSCEPPPAPRRYRHHRKHHHHHRKHHRPGHRQR